MLCLFQNSSITKRQTPDPVKIEVYKTNVDEPTQAGEIVQMLRIKFPGTRINFDLQDCDRILRVEGQNFDPEEVSRLLNREGFSCSCLE
jgi:hypothetical protein